MKTIIIVAICTLSLSSCDYVGNKTKKAINKTGEAIGEGSSEFAKGVSTGVDNTFNSTIEISETLKQKGISYGKFSITEDTGTSHKNKLVIYLIFDKVFNGNITAKVFDRNNREYGRVSLPVSAKQAEARYIDFIFDRRTDIENNSKFVVE